MTKSIFDYVKSINEKKYIDDVDFDPKEYNKYIVIKAFSYFVDTVLIANELDSINVSDERQHYDFLYHIINKRKRFSKWFKMNRDESIALIQKYYGCNASKAQEIVGILTTEQLDYIKDLYIQGVEK